MATKSKKGMTSEDKLRREEAAREDLEAIKRWGEEQQRRAEADLQEILRRGEARREELEASKRRGDELVRQAEANGQAILREQTPPDQRLTPANVIPVLVAAAIVVLAFKACEGITNAPTVASAPMSYDRITVTTKACPTKRGIELVLAAAPEGDGAVGATSLVNNCGNIAAGTVVDVVQATGDFALVKERSTGRQSWVVLAVAFRSP